MKKQVNIEDYEKNHFYFHSIEKLLSFYSLKSYYLTLKFEDINLSNYKFISVFLKNIKTREVLKCASKIEDNSLVINLKALNDLCTNYEYSIIVTLENYNYSTTIYPRLKTIDKKENSIISSSANSNIQWFLRILENGKLRLSTIYLFNNLEKDNTKITI
ncbi:MULTISPECIES: hypothetical protein [unclassified Clostridium]|uniref:hypothetical protein n=1 Tax=unclassified Clostridium TaxID=2614128 RepID=UPI0029075276|nr:hypothetical protein [Clostridium sp.]MDU5107950.1 hypothetical protein [Clostridium sp.]